MILKQIRSLVAEAVNTTYGVDDLMPEISRPEAKFGDFATNAAFHLAKLTRKNPIEIAQELALALQHDDVASAEAVRGFINIRMSNRFWLEQMQLINHEYGRSLIGEDTKVQVEFISANPTGPTTIGNARGGYLGDTLSRVLESQGYDVTREYYFNNAGTQISKLLDSVKVSAGLIQVDADKVQYKGDYIEELAQHFKEQLATQPDDELKPLLTNEILKRWIEPAIAKMGITFDVWFNEQDLLNDGRFAATIDHLKAKGLIYEQDGATWLDTGKLGVAREARVIVKSNGDPTYLAPDIAYHDDLFGARGFDVAIKVLGPDHIDQFPSVRGAVLALHPDAKLEMAGHQWFRLIKDGKEVKVSKRLGQFVTIEALVDEVGPDVARFMTLMRSADTHMDFDLDLAKEQSQKNPLYYVMYSYARAHSILQQAADRGLSPVSTVDELSEVEVALIRHITELPQLLHDISLDYGVHRLTFYGIEAAKLFHDLYESERIIDLDKAKASKRLYVIQRFTLFMEAYFAVLGVTPVKRMERDV